MKSIVKGHPKYVVVSDVVWPERPLYIFFFNCDPEGWSYQWLYVRFNVELLNRKFFVCVSVCVCNNAVRCTLPVLNAINPVTISWVYRYIQNLFLARSLLWRTLVIDLNSIKGENDHISKCWTLISKVRSRCPSILFWVTIDINSIILLLQRLLLYSVLQLNSVLQTELLISKGELQSLLTYLIV